GLDVYCTYTRVRGQSQAPRGVPRMSSYLRNRPLSLKVVRSVLVVWVALVPAQRSRLGTCGVSVGDLVLGFGNVRGCIDVNVLLGMLLPPPRRCRLGAARTPPGSIRFV